LTSRLSGRVFTWFYLFLWVFILFVWAWSTGWRNYFILEDFPVILILSLVLIFICWLDARLGRMYVSYPRAQ